MHGMNNIRKGLFVIYKLVLFENRVIRIMFEVKSKEMGGKGCKMWSFIIYTVCHIMWYQKTVAKWMRNVACLGVKVILNVFLIGKWEGKSPCGRSLSVWEDNIEVVFKEIYQDGF
jgi:hypothetical protein